MKIPILNKSATALLPPEQCLAKTCGMQKGCNEYTHLVLCALTVRALRDVFRGTPRENLISVAAEWLAALHDIGKATPGFQQKIYAALGEFPDLGVQVARADHAEYSGWILRERYGKSFAALAAAHHGIARKLPNPQFYNDSAAVCGGEGWSALRKQIREEVIAALKLEPCDTTSLPAWQAPLVLGAVVLADWICSGLELPWGAPCDAIDLSEAVAAAGFAPLRVTPDLDFEAIFEFQPNPLQQVCRRKPVPGEIVIIESEMGSGKTEAALYMAYQMLAAGQADGIYFALPTQLTSEKIHARLNQFLSRIIPAEKHHGALLIHGDAWLEWNLRTTDPEDCTTPENPDSWFQTRKRALLAPFGAGTIDQALLAVLNVKHNAVRAFGLSGKVVIIDECHSYDHYTGFLLKKLIRELRHYQCTVIVLSATLTGEARREFALLEPQQPAQPLLPYPLVTWSHPSNGGELTPFSGADARTVKVAFTENLAETLQLALEKAARGEQVLWIENTVSMAQQVFLMLSSCAGDCEIGLIDSRFPRWRRSENENKWVGLLGKNGEKKRLERGRILVGSQILEQSLDIDSDTLITRLAPMDMLFQRIGRLWRHRKLDFSRPTGAERRAVILKDPRLDQPEQILPDCDALLPYEAYPLCRTCEALKDKRLLTLPDDIRPMLEAVYRRRTESGALRAMQERLERKIETLERQARIAAGPVMDVRNDDHATTRINDLPTVQILLLEKNNRGKPLTDVLYSPFDGAPITLPSPSASKSSHVEAARRIMRTLITVPEHHAPRYDGFTAEFLASAIWIGNDSFRPIRVAYLDSDGRLLDRAANPLPFRYHEKIGYTYDTPQQKEWL